MFSSEHKFAFTILMSVLFIGTLSMMAFVLLQSNATQNKAATISAVPQKTPAVYPASTVKIQAAVPPKADAAMQTYSDTVFSFQYPKDWNIQTKTYTDVLRIKFAPPASLASVVEMVLTQSKNDTLSLKDKENFVVAFKPTREQKMLNGVQADFLYFTESSSSGQPQSNTTTEEQVFFEKNGYQYVVVIQYSLQDANVQQTVEAIIQSIQLL
jgi:hypothetical protein